MKDPPTYGSFTLSYYFDRMLASRFFIPFGKLFLFTRLKLDVRLLLPFISLFDVLSHLRGVSLLNPPFF
jgi:hypothetical protein